jgi:hypothetical protein
VLASNLVGDTQVYAGSTGFPTMSSDSTFSNTASIGTTPSAVPANPTGLSATVQAGPQVSLAWTDKATNETGFVVERCTGMNCSNFAQIATPGPSTSTGGSVIYGDATVSVTGTYSYRVKAVTASGSSAYTNTAANVASPAIPAAPTSVTVVQATAATTVTLTWAHTGVATDFTIQRATNATFTKGVRSFTATASPATQTVSKGTYYYRIRANGTGGSSAWTNASPFPIRVN